METRSDYQYGKTGFRAVHPGEILREELRERGISQKDFASMIGMQRSHLNELIKGTRNMTMATAEKLEEALGISSVTWMNLRAQYEHDCMVIEKRNMEQQEAASQDAAKSLLYINKTTRTSQAS
ncbi:MAG: HigA family addiction module antitoxin [Prevotellaceae bacterium]|nr:HigA family addiction module antitoxin [Prevotellaceae bacterium]